MVVFKTAMPFCVMATRRMDVVPARTDIRRPLINEPANAFAFYSFFTNLWSQYLRGIFILIVVSEQIICAALDTQRYTNAVLHK